MKNVAIVGGVVALAALGVTAVHASTPAAREKPAELAPATGSKEVTPTGGGAVRSEDGNARVTAPPGAVAEPTTFTLAPQKLRRNPRIRSGGYEAGPEGSTFERPVEVCLSLNKGASAENICLAYLDTSGETRKWKCEDECLQEKGDQYCGETTHFTTFALLLRSNGGEERSECDDDG